MYYVKHLIVIPGNYRKVFPKLSSHEYIASGFLPTLNLPYRNSTKSRGKGYR